MTLWLDLRHAWRILRHERATSAVIILTLSLAIAATSIMFGVVDQLLLRPPAGIGDADGVRRLYFGSNATARRAPNQSFPVLKSIAANVSAFAETATLHRADVTLGAGQGARQASLELVTASYFRLLELTPVAGRFFTPAEDRGADADPVVVLSHAFWQRELGGDPTAVGRDLLIEGKRFTIVGVARRGFSGARRDRIDLWAPPGALGRELLGDDWATTTNWYRFELIARLSPGATDAQADAQATAVYRRSLDAAGFSGAADVVAAGAPLNGLGRPGGIGFQARVGLWLLGVAAIVVLIACANVAGLQLARAIARRREFAVRVAIGASRGRLMRQLLTESALLSTVAAFAALFLTYFGGRLVQQLLVLPGASWDDSLVDGRVLAVTFIVSTLTALTTGMSPALHIWSAGVASAMRPAQHVSRGRIGVLRAGLLVAQVSLCVLLLVGAGLFVKSLAAARTYDVGLDLDRVIQASLPATLEPAAARALYAQAAERLATIPGVQRVALNGGSLRLKMGRTRSMTHEDPIPAGQTGPSMDAFFLVTPGYFDALGARVERGRDLTAEDDRLRARSAVVSRGFAERFWPGAEAVGRCVSFRIVFSRADCTTIIGVVENLAVHNRTSANEAQVYVLFSHPEFTGESPNALLIRTEAAAAPLVPVVRQALQTLTPEMGFVAAATLEEMYAPQLQSWRLGSWMFLTFGAIALLIAAVGLFSSLAFAVSQRTQEIGIRMALGASPWNITATIGTSSIATMAIGIGLGLLGAALATRWLSDLLFQTSPRDPIVFATVAIVLALVGITASIIPARRAAAVDPIVVLRHS
ncbi:MAG TPA: ADOP family duplicated permease [Vicinamibacterales bacterium]|nr:ADOP family duplicated permease [Vicinamibacterales bacterium]